MFLGSTFRYIVCALLGHPDTFPLDVTCNLFLLDNPTIPSASQWHRAFQEIVQSALDTLSENSSCHPPGNTPPAEWHQLLYKIFCQDSAQELAKILSGHQLKHVVIGLDKHCHWNQALPDQCCLPSLQMSLVVFQCIVKATDHFQPELNRSTYWYMLLDTSSLVFELVL